jgi:hypothetical protein
MQSVERVDVLIPLSLMNFTSRSYICHKMADVPSNKYYLFGLNILHGEQ